MGRGISKLTTWLGAGFGIGVGQELIKKSSTGSFNTGMEYIVFLGCEYSDSCYGVKWLIPYLDVKAIHHDGITPLHTACMYGHQEAVKAFINCKADIKAKDSEGNTPLHIASKYGHLEIVKILLSREGISMDVANRDGDTPLHKAAENKHKAIVETLLSRIDIKIDTINLLGDTSLHKAVEGGDLETIVSLLNNKADVKAKNHNGLTVLHKAYIKGVELETVKRLIYYNASVNAKDTKGSALLHMAAEREDVNFINYLIEFFYEMKEFGTDFNSEDSIEWIDIDIKQSFGLSYTPLHIAVKKGNQELIKILLKYGSKVYEETCGRMNALELALEHPEPERKLDLLELLIKSEADIGLRKKMVQGFLDCHRLYQIEVMEFLIKNGAELSTEKYSDSLNLTIQTQNMKFIQFFMKNGVEAEIDEKNLECRPLTLQKLLSKERYWCEGSKEWLQREIGNEVYCLEESI